jgi:hypothetical protein
MSAKPDTDAGSWKGRADLLSADEEAVLSEVREIVSCARGDSRTPDFRLLAQQVTGAGASLVNLGRDGALEFTRGTVRFSLRPVPGGRFEINFPYQDP